VGFFEEKFDLVAETQGDSGQQQYAAGKRMCNHSDGQAERP